MGKAIKDWSAAEIDKIYEYHLQELSVEKSEKERNKNRTTEQKRKFLQVQDDKFKQQFK